jgi:hypothetical protein
LAVLVFCSSIAVVFQTIARSGPTRFHRTTIQDIHVTADRDQWSTRCVSERLRAGPRSEAAGSRNVLDSMACDEYQFAGIATMPRTERFNRKRSGRPSIAPLA